MIDIEEWHEELLKMGQLSWDRTPSIVKLSEKIRDVAGRTFAAGFAEGALRVTEFFEQEKFLPLSDEWLQELVLYEERQAEQMKKLLLLKKRWEDEQGV